MMEEISANEDVPYHRNATSPLRSLEQSTHRCTSTDPRVAPLPNPPTRYRSNSKSAPEEISLYLDGAYIQESHSDSPRRESDDWVQGEVRRADIASEDIPSYTLRSFFRTRAAWPLIDLVKNEWRTNPRYGQTRSPSPDRSCQSRWTYAMTARRLQRYLLVYLLLVGACWLSWRWYLKPQLEEHLLLSESLDERFKTGKGWFGSNKKPAFNDMVHLKTLDKNLVPGVGSGRSRKRLIIVGDVHGCKDELVSLLDKVAFRPKNDHMIFAGDMISKGPHSPGVVDLARDMGASCVRGNHEDRALLAYRDIHSKQLALQGPDEDPHWAGDEMAEESFSHGDYRDRALARQLTARQVDWLRKCPVILKVGEIKGLGEVVVVHGGLVPGLKLETQDPVAVMNMRTIDLETHVPSDRRNGMVWSKLWNKYQRKLHRHSRYTVIYGHDAKLGLQLKRYSKGLDTGCVRGGRLTALIIEEGRWGGVKQTVVSVECKDYRRKYLAVDEKVLVQDADRRRY